MKTLIAAAALVLCSCVVSFANDFEVMRGIWVGQTAPTIAARRAEATSAVSGAFADLASAQGAGGNPMWINVGYASLGETSVYIARGDAWVAYAQEWELRNSDSNRHNDDVSAPIRGYRMAWMCYSNVLGHGNRAARFAASAMRDR
jgi:hypothetical protein